MHLSSQICSTQLPQPQGSPSCLTQLAPPSPPPSTLMQTASSLKELKDLTGSMEEGASSTVVVELGQKMEHLNINRKNNIPSGKPRNSNRETVQHQQRHHYREEQMQMMRNGKQHMIKNVHQHHFHQMRNVNTSITNDTFSM